MIKKLELKNLSVPVIGISRLRFGTDGEGITTLVAFQGCTLHCRYCLNKECWESESKFQHYTPEQLYEKLKVDDLYFRATEGGITFGGGEPALRADFSVAFRQICGPEWKIRLETSLNVRRDLIEKLAPVVDEWIIDIKAYNGETYRKYTKGNQSHLSSNLEYLLSKKGLNVPKEKVTIKVPVIPKYVSIKEADKALSIYKSWYGCRVDKVRYKDNGELQFYKDTHKDRDGKKICDRLKTIRKYIANLYGIEIPERNCKHEGNCQGTCPFCDAEVTTLLNELREKGIDKIEISEELKKMINNESDNQNTTDTNERNEELKEPQGKLTTPDLSEEIRGLMVERDEDEPLQGDVIPYPRKPDISEFYEYKKIFFKECAMAGISFYIEAEDEIWNELEEGTELALVRDKNNKHDKNAIAVALADDYNGDPDDFDFDFILGYVPRSDNSDLATMFDAGYSNKFSAKITTLKTYGNVNSRIRITIYIESNEPQLVRPDLFRGNTLNPIKLRNMHRELKEYGVAYFRFGGFPLSNYIMPIVGEKIVMFYPDLNQVVLYLTRVMAEGEDCGKYKKGWEDIYVDDQIGYVVSVISGPIIVDRSDLFFMFDSDILTLSAENYLSRHETLHLQKLFDNVLFRIINRGNIDMDTSIEDEKLRNEIDEEIREDKKVLSKDKEDERRDN